MQIDSSHIDDLFAQKLGNMDIPPPDGGWNRISQELDRRRNNRRKFIMAAASIAVLLGLLASYVYQQQDDTTPSYDGVVYVSPEPEINQKKEENTIKRGNWTENPVQLLEKEEQKQILPGVSVASVISSGQQPEPEEKTSAAEVTVAGPALPVDRTTPVFVNARNKTDQLQSIKMKRLELLSHKINAKAIEAVPASASNMVAKADVPVFDNISFMDDLPEVTRPKPANRWEIIGAFAPSYSYRSISDVPGNMNKADFDQSESGLLVYSGGVKVAYNASRRLSIQTGVYYTQMGQSVNHISSTSNVYASASSNHPYAKNFVHTSSGKVTVTSSLKAESNDNYASFFSEQQQALATSSSGQNVNMLADARNVSSADYKMIERVDYLEIPVILRYKVVDRKMNFYVLGGMSTNVLLDNNVFIDNGSSLVKEGNLLMVRPINYSSTVGLGISYQINRSLSFDLEPSFKYYLQSYTTNSSISSNPYSIGVYTMLVYRF